MDSEFGNVALEAIWTVGPFFFLQLLTGLAQLLTGLAQLLTGLAQLLTGLESSNKDSKFPNRDSYVLNVVIDSK